MRAGRHKRQQTLTEGRALHGQPRDVCRDRAVRCASQNRDDFPQHRNRGDVELTLAHQPWRPSASSPTVMSGPPTLLNASPVSSRNALSSRSPKPAVASAQHVTSGRPRTLASAVCNWAASPRANVGAGWTPSKLAGGGAGSGPSVTQKRCRGLGNFQCGKGAGTCRWSVEVQSHRWCVATQRDTDESAGECGMVGGSDQPREVATKTVRKLPKARLEDPRGPGIVTFGSISTNHSAPTKAGRAKRNDRTAQCQPWPVLQGLAASTRKVDVR
jgi:hypothetical protein